MSTKTNFHRFKYIVLECSVLLGLVCVFLMGFGWLSPAPAHANSSTFTVTTTDNSGSGSLRQAIISANQNPGDDDILFDIPGCSPASPCIISLQTLLPMITDSVTISGTDAASLIIDANHNFRGLIIEDVNVSIADLTIQNGSTTGRGGGIRSAGILLLTRVHLLDNQAGTDGGGVYAQGGLGIREGHFEGNAAQESGGGLYTDSLLAIQNTEFISNTAVTFGGGAYSYHAVVVGGVFEQNVSGLTGGGLAVDNTLALTGTLFLSNTANEVGGGLSATTAWINQAWFEGNLSEDGGGMIVFDDLHLTDVTLRHNTAVDDGGGVNSLGMATIHGSQFEGNRSGDDGGGLYDSGGLSIHVVDTSFTGNVAQNGDGGGIYTVVPVASTESSHDLLGGDAVVALTRTQFISNTALGYGGGVKIEKPFWINAGTFLGNQANIGGGVYHGSGNASVLNALFARNSANIIGASLALDSPDEVIMVYSTIVGATGNNAPGIGLSTGTLALINTIITDHAVGIRNANGTFNQDYNLFFQNGMDIDGSATGGAHSLNGDPHFVAPAAGDFHISTGSAALDMALDIFDIAVDFEEQPRPLGSGFDIGFDEADLISGLTISFSPNPTTTTYVSTTFTATVTGGSGVSYTWDFGDGSPPQSGNPLPHIYTAPGIYMVTVTATNSSGSITTSVEVEVLQGEQRIYLPVIIRSQ